MPASAVMSRKRTPGVSTCTRRSGGEIVGGSGGSFVPRVSHSTVETTTATASKGTANRELLRTRAERRGEERGAGNFMDGCLEAEDAGKEKGLLVKLWISLGSLPCSPCPFGGAEPVP